MNIFAHVYMRTPKIVPPLFEQRKLTVRTRKDTKLTDRMSRMNFTST